MQETKPKLSSLQQHLEAQESKSVLLVPKHILSDWLSRPGSLTAHLRALGRFELTVLHEQVRSIHADEARFMEVPPSYILLG